MSMQHHSSQWRLSEKHKSDMCSKPLAIIHNAVIPHSPSANSLHCTVKRKHAGWDGFQETI